MGPRMTTKSILSFWLFLAPPPILAVSIFSAAEIDFYEDPNLVTKIRIKKTISASISVSKFRLEQEKTQLKHFGTDLKLKITRIYKNSILV